MAIQKFKTLALVSALVLGITGMPYLAKAANNATIGVAVTTHSTITTSSPRNLNFNTWLIIRRSTDSITITMNNAGTLVQGGTVTTSTVQNLDNLNGTTGKLSVDLPDGSSGTVLQMSRTAVGGTLGAGLAVTAITYSTATETGNNAFTSGASVPVTVASGAVPEVVTFGGTITATATPSDGTHTDTFDVSFAY